MPVYQERKQDVYRAIYMGCEEKLFDNPDTNEQELRFIWKFQEVADKTSSGQIDKITGTSLKSPNSNAYKMASGIIGRKLEPGDDTEAHVGEAYDVWYGPNQNGNLTIVNVVPVANVASGPASSPAQAEPGPTTPDELPF